MENLERLVVTMYAESQIHAGKGMDIGVVDLPIQRERTTKFPIIQGVKGSLRSNIKLAKNEEIEIFGSDPSESSSGEESKPGSVAFSEAKILLFPVRQPDRLFVWVTSPLALLRFLSVLETEKAKQLLAKVEQTKLSDEEALSITTDGEIWLEEIKIKAKKCEWLKELAELISESVGSIEYIKNKVKTDIIVVKDEVFSSILETMTDVVPRVRIDKEKGTVAQGALWYEEYLPQDTIMYFVARKTAYAKEDALDKLKAKIDEQLITIGGKESVGKGLVTLKVVNVK